MFVIGSSFLQRKKCLGYMILCSGFLELMVSLGSEVVIFWVTFCTDIGPFMVTLLLFWLNEGPLKVSFCPCVYFRSFYGRVLVINWLLFGTCVLYRLFLGYILVKSMSLIGYVVFVAAMRVRVPTPRVYPNASTRSRSCYVVTSPNDRRSGGGKSLLMFNFTYIILYVTCKLYNIFLYMRALNLFILIFFF